MELQHRFTVPASVDTTWTMFNDLEAIAPCFPGAALTSAEGDDFAGTVKVKLGPVALQYSGTGTFVERDEASHTARFEAKGKDKRGNGTAAAKVKAVLVPDGSGTTVEVSTDLSVTGKPAQFGRGLMQDVSDKLLAKFVDCLTDKLTSPEPAGEPAPTGEPAPATATGTGAETEPAAGAGEAGPPADASPVEPSGAAASSSGAAGAAAAAAEHPSGSAAGPASPTTPSAASTRSTASTQSTTSDAPPPPRAEPRREEPAAELDLGATVLPVLAKRYGPPALGLLLVLLVLRRLLRR